MNSAGNLAGTFSESVAQTEIGDGESLDKQNEREAQIFSSIIGGFGNTPTSILKLSDPFAIPIAAATNLASNGIQNAMKTDNAGLAKTKANTEIDDRRAQSKAVILSAFEDEAYAITSGQKPADTAQKEKAQR